MILDVDPKVDYAFKYVFGHEPTKPILINMIDSVRQSPPGGRIVEIELRDPFNPKESSDDKLSILDVKARDESGRQYNIEMQMLPFPDYEKRVVYYSAKFHQQQLREGQHYRELRPTISISFLNHTMFRQAPAYHLKFRLLEETHHFPLCDDLEFHILELPKFTKTADELSDGLDIWLYFLRHAEKMDIENLPAAIQGQPMLLRAVEELKMLTTDELERERYESRLKAQRDHTSGLDSAELKGEQIGTIRTFEKVLGRPQTEKDHLKRMSWEELTQLAEDLQQQVLKRP